MEKTDCALIMQGGGALGAFEWGAVLCLLDNGYNPKVVTGVSIGAINAAAVAGAPDGDVKASINALWNAITIPLRPFFPPEYQSWTSMFGNAAFWNNRSDYLNMRNWTSICNVDPMRKTLSDLVDFKRLNNTEIVRIGVNATQIRTGTIKRFRSTEHELTIEHILASGALPPGFPPVEIDGDWYWDGGLLGNTPIRTALDMMHTDDYDAMPIFCLDLFPTRSDCPKTFSEVMSRMAEISYMNKASAHLNENEELLAHIHAAPEHISPDSPIFKTALSKRAHAYAKINVITAAHSQANAGADFSEYGLKQRRDDGYRATERYLNEHKRREKAPSAHREKEFTTMKPRKTASAQ